MLRRVCVLIAMLAAFSAAAAAQTPPPVDLAKLSEEATGWLADLIRIDTTNPPGNELAAAKYIAAVLDREGIRNEVLESAPGRGVVIARLQAGPLPDPSRALLLLGHTDVVGVQREKWSVDPFGGAIKDGYLWGRGALDCKGMVAANLAVMVALKRSGMPLTRDVIFLAEGDEESSGEHGIEFVIRNHWEKIAAAFALNEGGHVRVRDGKVLYADVQASEKISVNIEVIATGPSGHASIPRADNPILRLAEAVAKIGRAERPVKINTVTERYFEQLAKVEDPELAKWMRALQQPERLQLAARRLSEANPAWNAMLRTTITPTILDGGIRANVIPADARATLNVRLFPGESPHALVEELCKLVDDPQIRFEVGEFLNAAAPASSLDTEFYRLIEQVTPQVFPGAVVVPAMSTWGTDSLPLRIRNVQAYGLQPFPLTAEEIARIHGDDERIPLDSFRRGVAFLYTLVSSFAHTQ